MIKSGLKNYGKSFKYFFVPLGALALGIVVALSIMVPMVWSAVKNFVHGAAAIVGSHSPNWEGVKDTLVTAVRDLDWSHPQDIASTVFTKDYLLELLRSCARAAIGDVSVWEAEIEALSETFISEIEAAFVVGIVFIALGIFGAFFVTRILIRHDLAKRNLWRGSLVALADTLINSTVVALGALLVVKVQNLAILSLFLMAVLYGTISFFEAYLAQGYKKIPLKEVLHTKNVLKLILLALIEVAIMMAAIVIVFALTNVMIGTFVGFGIFVITQSCISLNAEAYIKNQVEEKKKKKLVPVIVLTDEFKGLVPAPEEEKEEGAEGESAPGEEQIAEGAERQPE